MDDTISTITNEDVDYYVNDEYSALNYNLSSFQRLIDDIENRKNVFDW